ncbi:PREDICTED: scavenger receptor cysteine-rich domain-containing group B protein [Charadrius vociferus]|uniref:scavenger receptor cysteine-rich domain-containing group B protein n=1 Tax=Charadrius vociferus TaxID=50402 RepID=UPI00052166CB|nr:PREDICTED: scavenger receptor cysteine-rich domain-containing group B protein [Charadrius vociferus]
MPCAGREQLALRELVTAALVPHRPRFTSGTCTNLGTTSQPALLPFPEIRLANGPSRCQGRVEILYNGSWGTVCDDDWDIVDANVVCRQLGCGHAITLPAAMTFGQGSGPIFLDNVDCKGREAALSECWSHGWGIHNCYHYEDVAVVCNGDGSIRLVSGTDTCQGRVEIFYRGNWGTVCDDDWGLSDASVVCKQVGCGQALDYKSNAYFGYGTGRILLDNVNCDGSEPFLSACYSLGWGIHNCGHHEDAGVICTGLDRSTITSFTTSVALDYEETLTATATATDDRNQPSQATELVTTALLTVEQETSASPTPLLGGSDLALGGTGVPRVTFPTPSPLHQALMTLETISKKPLLQPPRRPWLVPRMCKAHEHSLLRCSHIRWDVHNCDHSEDAGAVCGIL